MPSKITGIMWVPAPRVTVVLMLLLLILLGDKLGLWIFMNKKTVPQNWFQGKSGPFICY